MERVSAPMARLSTATLPAAWMASTCSHPSASRTRRAASPTGWMTPVSLLASIRATKGLPSAASQACRRSASQARSATPFASTGSTSTAAPEALAVSRTLSCSMAETISRRAPAATALSMAMALASVPPLVKITVEAGAAIRAATSSRAFSTRSRAARPLAWTDEGLPTFCSAAIMAAWACGRTGAVAL